MRPKPDKKTFPYREFPAGLFYFMNKISPKLKIIIGLILVIIGFLGLNLAFPYAEDVGVKCEDSVCVRKNENGGLVIWCLETGCDATALNEKFIKCQQENEKKGRVYPILHTFVDGVPVNKALVRRVRENERQCKGEPVKAR